MKPIPKTYKTLYYYEVLEFFKTQLLAEKGEHKLNVFLQNPLDNTFVEARALHQTININNQLLEKIHEFGKFEIYLN